MDDTPKLLAEIRDMLQRESNERAAERVKQEEWRAACDAQLKLSSDAHSTTAKLLRRTLFSVIFLAALALIVLFTLAAKR